jgi:hypothetical protein
MQPCLSLRAANADGEVVRSANIRVLSTAGPVILPIPWGPLLMLPASCCLLAGAIHAHHGASCPAVPPWC